MKKVKYHLLYMQVRNTLLEKIVNCEYVPNIPLPAEMVLAENFGTGISTIRQSVSTLVSDGIVVRRHGKGTYLSEHSL
jgi:GntR family transcriptional regulator